jgi:hypothetical protein
MTFPFRGIIKLTGSLLRRSWLPLALVTVCLYLLPAWGNKALQTLAFHSYWRGLFISASGGFGPAAWAFIVIFWLLRGLHMSAVTEIALRTAASKPIRPGRLILNAAITAVPILILQFLLEIVVVVGSFLLVVPGLFFGAAFSVVVPAYICEGKSLPEAFRQSFKLTRSRRFPIGALWFSIILVVDLLTGNLLAGAISMESVIHHILPAFSLPVLPMPAALSPFFASPLGVMLTTLASQVYTVALMVLNVAIYLGLRFHKTESADNQIAALFE